MYGTVPVAMVGLIPSEASVPLQDQELLLQTGESTQPNPQVSSEAQPRVPIQAQGSSWNGGDHWNPGELQVDDAISRRVRELARQVQRNRPPDLGRLYISDEALPTAVNPILVTDGNLEDFSPDEPPPWMDERSCGAPHKPPAPTKDCDPQRSLIGFKEGFLIYDLDIVSLLNRCRKLYSIPSGSVCNILRLLAYLNRVRF